MSKLQQQCKAPGITMMGTPPRFWRTRMRVALRKVRVRPVHSFSRYYWTPYIRSYTVSDLAVRFYFSKAGWDEGIDYKTVVSFRDFGTSGTPPNDLPLPAYEDGLRSSEIVVETGRNGAPVYTEIPTQLETSSRGGTHLSLGIIVMSYDLTFDMDVCCELWANAWREHRGPVYGNILGNSSTDRVPIERTDMRQDLTLVREQLT